MLNIICMFGLGLLAIFVLFVVAVDLGLLNDPDGKESRQEYWEALKEMREREKNNGRSY